MISLKTNFMLRSISIFVFFLLWTFFSTIFDSSLLPNPTDVFSKIMSEFKSSELVFHTSLTLRRVLISFTFAMLIGTVVGILLGRREKFNAFFDDWLVLGLNVPALVIIILCYVWFGLNETAAVLAVALNKIPMVAVIMREGARSLDKQYIDVAKFYNVDKKKNVCESSISSTISLPNVFSQIWFIPNMENCVGC